MCDDERSLNSNEMEFITRTSFVCVEAFNCRAVTMTRGETPGDTWFNLLLNLVRIALKELSTTVLRKKLHKLNSEWGIHKTR